MKYKCLECGAPATAEDSRDGVMFVRTCSHLSSAIDYDFAPVVQEVISGSMAASLSGEGGLV